MATTASCVATSLIGNCSTSSSTTSTSRRFNLRLNHNLVLNPWQPSRFRLHSRTTATAPFSALPFDISPPPIDLDLEFERESVEDGKVSKDGILETYDNNDEALDAVDNGAAVVDLSHFGRIRVTGEDRIQFLHNQSTANFQSLSEGQGCDTVFVTPTARTIDIAYAWIMKKAVTLVVSPSTCASITEMLTKYIFFADKVEVQDITKQTRFFILIGPKSNQVMNDLNLSDLVGQPYGTHRHYNINGMPITIGKGNVISREGYSLLMSPDASKPTWSALLSQGAIPMGSNTWEKLRIYQGRPEPGKELTSEFNVLEAGLWNSISTSKGCYKGQETIARLITYDGIKQSLWGVSLSAAAQPGSPITVDGKKVGKLTSYATGKKGCEHFGLGYIKRKAASVGDTVMVGDNVVGTVVEVPFLSCQSLSAPISNVQQSNQTET